MQTAATSRTNTNDAFTGLTYINTLVTGATIQGLSSISVAASYLSTTTIILLKSYGYDVSPYFSSFDIDTPNVSPQSYNISW